jgi:putative SOS response-associated peptidase YedK
VCGRYVIISEIKEIEKRFGVFAPQPELFQKNVNVSAGERAPVISSANPGELSFYHFGFSPAWSEKRMYLLNARSEGDANADNDPAYTGGLGIIQKPAFRKAIRSQRCLVVADAFLEGPEKEKLSKPYCVYKKDGERPFAFAGIWEEWLNKATGELLPTFAIITAPANDVLQAIGHHRAPVILPKEAEALWLDQLVPLAEITKYLRSPANGSLNAYPISPDIKKASEKDPWLLKRTGERVMKEYRYELHESLKLEGMGSTSARQRKLNLE